ncbi:hypothetical protein [Nitrosomonas sp.]|uniref:hypothetical protein n=1 Tax=Nitrosomonas sp. TaxID=42353 RepID=UPI0025D773A3|nr:hypothetical protein [Nitrosomonas sp.]
MIEQTIAGVMLNVKMSCDAEAFELTGIRPMSFDVPAAFAYSLKQAFFSMQYQSPITRSGRHEKNQRLFALQKYPALR